MTRAQKHEAQHEALRKARVHGRRGLECEVNKQGKASMD